MSFADYIADQLTSALATTGCADFILRQDDDLVYVDVEDASFYLIRVQKAEATVAPSLTLPRRSAEDVQATKGTAVSS